MWLNFVDVTNAVTATPNQPPFAQGVTDLRLCDLSQASAGRPRTNVSHGVPLYFPAYQIILFGDRGKRVGNKFLKVAVDGAAAGNKPAISNHKSNLLTTRPPAKYNHHSTIIIKIAKTVWIWKQITDSRQTRTRYPYNVKLVRLILTRSWCYINHLLT